MLLHNTLPLYELCVDTVKEGGTTIYPKKATAKVVQRCMSKRLYSVCVVRVCVCVRVCPRAREQELRAEWWWWGGGVSEKETTNGRKNGLQAKQSARQPIASLEAAAIPYKAGTHKLTLVGMYDVGTNTGHQGAHSAPPRLPVAHAIYIYRAVIFKHVLSQLSGVQVSISTETLQQQISTASSREEIISEHELI